MGPSARPSPNSPCLLEFVHSLKLPGFPGIYGSKRPADFPANRQRCTAPIRKAAVATPAAPALQEGGCREEAATCPCPSLVEGAPPCRLAGRVASRSEASSSRGQTQTPRCRPPGDLGQCPCPPAWVAGWDSVQESRSSCPRPASLASEVSVRRRS